MEVYTDLQGKETARIQVKASDDRTVFSTEMKPVQGVHALYFIWRSKGTADFFSFTLQ